MTDSALDGTPYILPLESTAPPSHLCLPGISIPLSVSLLISVLLPVLVCSLLEEVDWNRGFAVVVVVVVVVVTACPLFSAKP